MDVADWMTFEILKKRALAVCQEVRQQLFVLNSQRRVQALMETAQLHTTFLMSFKVRLVYSPSCDPKRYFDWLDLQQND